MNLLGANALLVDDGYALSELQRVFLESRAETIYGGASEIQRNIVGERILGLPARAALSRASADQAHLAEACDRVGVGQGDLAVTRSEPIKAAELGVA